MSIIFGIFLFSLGIFVGFLTHWSLGRLPDGTIIVTEDENGSKKFLLDFEDVDPYFLDKKKIITFSVIRAKDEPIQKGPMPKPPKSNRPSQEKHGL